MTAAYKESFEEPDATTRYRTAGTALHVESVEHLLSKKKAKKAVNRPFRVLTANVRSVPEDALSYDEVLEDLQRNAADGDLVFLQGIDPRFRPLVKRAFPRAEWDVFYGKDTNREPIVFRKSLFSMVTGQVSVLHSPRPGLNARRFLTCLQLRFKPLHAEFHATNLQLLDGAFGKEELPCREARLALWTAGVAKHRAFVQHLVETGLPVIGGGVFDRTLKQHKPLGNEQAGKPVTYAVHKNAGDLLWFIDGDRSGLHLRSTDEFPGRSRRYSERNSDSDARRATFVLRPVTESAPRPKRHRKPDLEPTGHSAGHSTGNSTGHSTGKSKGRPKRHKSVVDDRYDGHGPFDLTQFGDKGPKTVDWKTRAALEEAERRLGYTLTVVQGSYNNGRVKASGPTHDGGGVVDLLAYDWKRKVRVLRSIGFAAWYRPKTSKWNPHIHAVLIEHGRLDPSAARQVDAYRRGRNGLADDGRDTFWRPDPIPVFRYPPKVAASGGVRPLHPDEKPGDGPRPTGSPYPLHGPLDGVDVSHYQSGRINIPQAQAAGLKFMYAKTTEGTTVPDRTYRAKMRMARRAGIPFGSYHFARPGIGDARREAMYFLKRADIRAGDMVPMLDLETTEGLNRSQLTTWVGTWVATVERELARKGLVGKPIIYTRFDLDNGFGCRLWVARYNESGEPPRIPAPWKRAAVWQHSNGVVGPVKHVPGFGPVDVNALHPDIPLSALRLTSGTSPTGPRPKVRPANVTKARRKNQPTAGARSVDNQLRAAQKNIAAALEALPER